ncbi:hypothetical protein [Leuconostoc citreum]|uniref:hypothetical protein n=1 Tax=Leuconostoc citreum TaxID=33964 RepID=UPI001C1FC795|nr:hypothetical protein [Leuconostoc citreum]MBU7450672.1 hypothetical protein [Leuconostoc citreum]MCT3075331.1 hypothetical protein [Leuconostoc citreum]
MDEQTKQRLKHIRDATEVNKRHADMLRTQSESRHERARVQIKSEVMENRNINYRKHMKWLSA